MSEPVKIYVYDLSQGMARSMSKMLTGKQIGTYHKKEENKKVA